MFLFVALAFCLVFCIFLIVKLIDTTTSDLAPTIGTPVAALPQICDELQIQDKDEVWEVGCGDARVISYCARKFPRARFVGVENGIIANIKARLKTHRQKNVKIIFADIRNCNPEKATKMYLYLLPKTLNLITDSIPKKCRVISLEFPIARAARPRVVAVKESAKFANKLFIHQF